MIVHRSRNRHGSRRPSTIATLKALSLQQQRHENFGDLITAWAMP
jgi:hypothetical protein